MILEILLARAGRAVTRDEIRETLWPSDTFVDFEHGLNTSVKKLRQVLCDSADEPSYIETVRGLGYRFIAPVEVEVQAQVQVEETESLPENRQVAIASEQVVEIPAAVSAPTAESPSLRKLAVFVLIAIALLLAAGGLFYQYRGYRQSGLTESDTVVLADFDNSTGDAIFDETLKTALNVSLRQSPFLNVLSDTRVTKTLQLMTRPCPSSKARAFAESTA